MPSSRKEGAARSLAGSSILLSAANLLFVALSTLQVLVAGAVLGTARSYELFILAWMIPEWFLFGFGNVLQMHLTPALFGIEAEQGEDALAEATSTVAVGTMLVLAAVCLAGVIFAGPLLELSAAGLESGERALAVRLFRFLMLTTWAQGAVKLLGTLHRIGHSLTAVAIAQTASPLAVISVLLAAPFLGAWIFPVGLSVGAVIQVAWLVRAPLGWGLLRQLRLRWQPVLSELAASTLPLILTTTGFRVVLLIDRSVASTYTRGDVAVLRYAVFFLMAVQGLVVQPFLSAGFNRLSALAGRGRSVVADAALLITAVLWLALLPVALIQTLFAGPLVKVFLGMGAFDADAVQRTARALSAYAPMLPFLAGYMATLQAFLSQRRYGFVAALSVAMPLGSLTIKLAAGSRWGVEGLAWLTSLTMAVWCLALFLRLRPEANGDARRKAVSGLWRLTLAAAITGLTAWGLRSVLPAAPILRLSLGAGAVFFVYAVILWAVARHQLVLLWREFSEARMGA